MDRIPRIIGYGRVSTDHQTQSLPIQKQTIESWVKFQLERPGSDYEGYTYAGFFPDEASACKESFLQRSAGSMIAGSLGPGDVVVVSHFDRMFRKAGHIDETLDHFEARGAKFIAIDFQIDSGTPMGRAVLMISSAVKYVEAEEIRRRNVGGLRRRKSLLGFATVTPIGWRVLDIGLLPDNECRWIGAAVVSFLRRCDNPPARKHLYYHMNRASSEFYDRFEDFKQKNARRSTISDSSRLLVRIAAHCAVGWPIMTSKEVCETYYAPIASRKTDARTAIESVSNVKAVDSLMASGKWPWADPGPELTLQRIEGFRQHRAMKKMKSLGAFEYGKTFDAGAFDAGASDG